LRDKDVALSPEFDPVYEFVREFSAVSSNLVASGNGVMPLRATANNQGTGSEPETSTPCRQQNDARWARIPRGTPRQNRRRDASQVAALERRSLPRWAPRPPSRPPAALSCLAAALCCWAAFARNERATAMRATYRGDFAMSRTWCAGEPSPSSAVASAAP
jgi:hypothetical protein